MHNTLTRKGEIHAETSESYSLIKTSGNFFLSDRELEIFIAIVKMRVDSLIMTSSLSYF